ncbi:MAG: class I SAM-dependent methyltransferase [Oscillospiraceae bacterium]|nr:class I SAM-dependent methyltransferase [Oscillospiraceae bacterium]
MLDNKGFDLWADDYDQSVGVTDDDGEYPFAGYKEVLARIYDAIMGKDSCSVLDIGIGTATLSTKLYEAGNNIVGIDFSQKMLRIAAERMPNAALIQHDITNGLPDLGGRRFDFIISTYAMHHLGDSAKIALIKRAVEYLSPGGKIIIGDIAFKAAEDQEKCRKDCGDGWDDDEFYFVMSQLEPLLADFDWNYQQISHCGGILTLRQRD